MKRSAFVLMGITSIVMLSGLGVLTSYAVGSGEATNYYKSGTASIQTIYNNSHQGHWELQKDEVTWKFKLFSSDEYLRSAWVQSVVNSNEWYFLNNDGNMLKNATTPDGYLVNNEGLWKATEPKTTLSQEQVNKQVEQRKETVVETLDQQVNETLQNKYESMAESIAKDPENIKDIKEHNNN